MKDLTQWEIRMMELEERLLPIARRPVDMTDPNCIRRLQEESHPLDEASVRADADALLEELIDQYQSGPTDTREAIRQLFAKYDSFSWGAALPYAPTSEASFLRHLVLFSIQDQGKDTRDAILWLRELCHAAAAAGIVAAPILESVAELSSDENKYGMGSTKRLILNERAHSAHLPEPGVAGETCGD